MATVSIIYFNQVNFVPVRSLYAASNFEQRFVVAGSSAGRVYRTTGLGNDSTLALVNLVLSKSSESEFVQCLHF